MCACVHVHVCMCVRVCCSDYILYLCMQKVLCCGAVFVAEGGSFRNIQFFFFSNETKYLQLNGLIYEKDSVKVKKDFYLMICVRLKKSKSIKLGCTAVSFSVLRGGFCPIDVYYYY